LVRILTGITGSCVYEKFPKNSDGVRVHSLTSDEVALKDLIALF
jgi:hypothetical protein